MRPTLQHAACAISLALLATGPLHATVLTFDNGNTTTPTLCTADIGGNGPLTACNAGSSFSQSYGDQAGRIDVRYATPRAATSCTRARSSGWMAPKKPSTVGTTEPGSKPKMRNISSDQRISLVCVFHIQLPR